MSPFTDAQVAIMNLPPSAAPRRRAPPPGRLCGRSLASSERHWVASLIVVPAGALVSGAHPQPCPKGTTARCKPALCASRASPDPDRRPSTRRIVRRRRGPGVGDTRRQPSPARPAVAAYGISPRSRCGLPGLRQRGRPVHNPVPDIGSFVGHVSLLRWGFRHPRGALSPGNRGNRPPEPGAVRIRRSFPLAGRLQRAQEMVARAKRPHPSTA